MFLKFISGTALGRFLPLAALLSIFMAVGCSSGRRTDHDAQRLLPSLMVTEREEETELIDATAIAQAAGKDGAQLTRAGMSSVLLPRRDLTLNFFEFTGRHERVVLMGETDAGHLDVPIMINGQCIGIWLASQRGSCRISLPPASLRKGRNLLTIGLSNLKRKMERQNIRLRLSKIEFSMTSPRLLSGPGVFSFQNRKIDGYWQSVTMPEINVYLQLPGAPCRLRFDVGFEAPCDASLTWTPESGGRQLIYTTHRQGKGLVECNVRIDGGGFGRLSMGVPNGRIFWGNPRLVLDGPPPTKTPMPSTPPFNIIIFLVDALRADALQPYGYHRETSPFLRQFAAESKVFIDALGHTSWTKPSVASLLTGYYPMIHQVTRRNRILHSKIVTLAERLSGFQRVFFSTQPLVVRETGFAQGFESGYYAYPSTTTALEVNRLLRPVIGDLSRKKTPFFLYVHAMDPHYPYDAIPPFDNLIAHVGSELESVPDKHSVSFIRDLRQRSALLASRDVEYLRSLYDSEVRRSDFGFSEFIDSLKKAGIYDNTMIIFTADHGEEFRDHGGFLHGHTLYQEIVHLPLIVKSPKGLGRPGIVTARVQQIDIVPTILELMGRPIPDDLPGHSFASLFHQGAYTIDTVFAETELKGKILSATNGQWKLITFSQDESPSPSDLLFALDSDPAEKVNLSEQHPMIVSFFRQELHRWMRDCQMRQKVASDEATIRLSKEDLQNMRALGYIE